MKKANVLGLTLLFLAGMLAVGCQFGKDPADVGEAFLEQIVLQDFRQTDNLLPDDSQEIAEELAGEFHRFGEAFGLTEVEIVDFAPLSRTTKEAVFKFVLKYSSRYFEPIRHESELTLTRANFFSDWQVMWENNLPLSFGLDTVYSRTRVEPWRGSIRASNGEVLAGAGSLIAVGVQPDRITDAELLLSALEKHLALAPDYVQRQYEKPGIQGHWFVPLINISETLYQEVDEVLRPIPGIFFRREEARAYPQKEICGHITGYLGEVTNSMLTSFPERDYLSGEIVGRSGIESGKDGLLRGTPGYQLHVEPSSGNPLLLAEKPLVEGEDLDLTLDLTLQQIAMEVLQSIRGSLVVLDGETGAILALASSPSYDPNEFVGGISSARWDSLSTDPDKPLFNRALQGLYPPGSVFKILTAAAALDQDLVEPDTVFVDSGELSVQGNIVRNFQNQVFGEHEFSQAVFDSVNTTLAQVGLDLGAPLLEDYFNRWGLGDVPQLGLPVAAGQIGSPGRSRVALAWSAIGQDQVLVTPLQVAQIFTVFANQGLLPPIHLFKQDDLAEPRPVLKEQTVEQINAMLAETVRVGTGKAARVSGLQLFAKTGTAEVGGEHSHAWFGGHTRLPSGQSIAFALLVEEGGVGGQVAAPKIQEFLQLVLEHKG